MYRVNGKVTVNVETESEMTNELLEKIQCELVKKLNEEAAKHIKNSPELGVKEMNFSLTEK